MAFAEIVRLAAKIQNVLAEPSSDARNNEVIDESNRLSLLILALQESKLCDAPKPFTVGAVLEHKANARDAHLRSRREQLKEMTEPRFYLGTIALTAGVHEKVVAQEIEDDEIIECLRRHAAGDCGDVDMHDRAVNDRAMRSGGRVLSVYKLGRESARSAYRIELWIITEADRSSTTVLLPVEY